NLVAKETMIEINPKDANGVKSVKRKTTASAMKYIERYWMRKIPMELRIQMKKQKRLSGVFSQND
ncbi:MAG: hypothetical protein K0U13_04960, partial [Chlamydiae bacterium]|nr:hypothetical protein [Chlamydiota bacterium]